MRRRPSSGPVVVGAPATAREHAAAVWADVDARAAWQVGTMDVPPAVDAALCALERHEYPDAHVPDDVSLVGGPDGG